MWHPKSAWPWSTPGKGPPFAAPGLDRGVGEGVGIGTENSGGVLTG